MSTVLRTGRRNTELGLILLVVIITAATYTLATLGELAAIPANIVPFLVATLLLLVAAHIAVRKLAPNADPLFVFHRNVEKVRKQVVGK